MERNFEPLTYRSAGVDAEGEAAVIQDAIRRLAATCIRPKGRGSIALTNGFFATVLDVGGQGLAISTDGVGTKVMVAQALGRYDSIGIDCVAMNVNDILCVGAEPITLLDYLAVSAIDPGVMRQLMEGLARGAEQAHVAIPGGETAQVPDLLHPGDRNITFDLVGTGLGTVALERVVDGAAIQSGDVVVGLASSGIHSNGMTLARRVFRDKGIGYGDRVEEFGRTLGEELLEPTRIYVDAVMGMMRAGLPLRGLAHITGDGFANLLRFSHPSIGFVIDMLPAVPAIFGVLQELGGIADLEMFRTYNMGVGFCVVLPEAGADDAIAAGQAAGVPAMRIGRASDDPKVQGRVLVRRGGGESLTLDRG